MASQNRPSKRQRTGDAAIPAGVSIHPQAGSGLPAGLMQPPRAPVFYPHATYAPLPAGMPPPPPPPPPRLLRAPALNPQATHFQGSWLQQAPVYGQAPPQQPHAQGHPSAVTVPQFAAPSTVVTDPRFRVAPPHINMVNPSGQGQGSVTSTVATGLPFRVVPPQINMVVRQNPSSQGQGPATSVNVTVLNSQRKFIFGKKRSVINWMQSQSGASIVVVAHTASETTFEINGQPQNVAMAQKLMHEAILEANDTIDLGYPGSPPQKMPGYAYKMPDAGTSQQPP